MLVTIALKVVLRQLLLREAVRLVHDSSIVSPDGTDGIQNHMLKPCVLTLLTIGLAQVLIHSRNCDYIAHIQHLVGGLQVSSIVPLMGRSIQGLLLLWFGIMEIHPTIGVYGSRQETLSCDSAIEVLQKVLSMTRTL